MAAAPSGTREGIVIATGVLALAIVFSWRQWVERRRRIEADDLSDPDRAYFSGKDLRRFAGTAILGLIGVGMVAGCLIDYRASKAAGQLFLWIWMGVGALICASLVLAIFDWQANRDYAIRHLRELAEERRALWDEERPTAPPPATVAAGKTGRSKVDNAASPPPRAAVMFSRKAA